MQWRTLSVWLCLGWMGGVAELAAQDAAPAANPAAPETRPAEAGTQPVGPEQDQQTPDTPNGEPPAARKSTPGPAGFLAVIHAPVGGRAVSIGEAGVLCGRNVAPWTTMSGGHLVVPPSSDSAIGLPVDVSVAPSNTECSESQAQVRLIATGPRPQLEPESVELSIDEGRADAQGTDLSGSVLWWQSGESTGMDTCYDAKQAAGRDQCTWSTGQGLVADPDQNTLGIYPRGSMPGPNAQFFDPRGRLEPDSLHLLKPARILLQRLWPHRASVDLAAGQGTLALHHPEAVAAVECGPLSCEMGEQGLIVRAADAPHDSAPVTLRLRPRVRVQDGKRLLSVISETVSLLHCPMTIVSGEPFRDNESAKVAVRLEGQCAREVPRLTFRAGRRRMNVLELHQAQDGTVAMLQLGRVGDEEITITASAESTGHAVIAVARARTRAVPNLRAVLEVPGFPEVDFLPTNRWARVHVAPPADDIHVVALPITGVYQARYEGIHSDVRGDPHAAGLTGLRVALRSNLLPEQLRGFDLAVVTDPLLRSIHAANVPAQLNATDGRKALVEFVCRSEDNGSLIRLPIGETKNLAFGTRDTCRVVFHRNLLQPEDGVQRIRLQVDIVGVDGTPRGTRVDDILTLSPGKEGRSEYTHGVEHPFDRMTVRISHVADDTYYLGASELGTGVAAAQWSVIFGTARARLYATTAFPTGLYRLSDRDHSGVLSLNFGLLSRLTWLDREGQEGLLSLETGLVVIGIGNAVTDDGNSLTQVGAVVGLGLSVPFANRSTATQASLNVHAWMEIDVTRDDESGSDGRVAFIFGPSLSIGNLGANL